MAQARDGLANDAAPRKIDGRTTRYDRLPKDWKVPKSTTPEYNAWRNMRDRCYREKHPYYHRYGGRGVKVCDRWLKSFEAFLQDVGPRPSGRHSLDRFPDNDGNYEPGNVRWALPVEQVMNRQETKRVLYRGQEVTLVVACRLAGLRYNTVLQRLYKGWPVEEALETPIDPEISERIRKSWLRMDRAARSGRCRHRPRGDGAPS